jgi:hypothetical protein
VIFSRKHGSADRSEPGRHRASDGYGSDADPSASDDRSALPVSPLGPYDSAVAPDDDLPRVDLGALRIPNMPGVALQLEAAPDGQIVRVQLEHQGSRLQLGAFAAPRTEGIWDEVRGELRTAQLSSGAKVVEVAGDYGPELAVRYSGGGEGAGSMELRHIGIDGPRWFVHAVLVGPAAVDPGRAGPLTDVLRGLVVDRGAEARPVKEALALRLPPEYQAQLAELAAAQAAARPASTGSPAAPARPGRTPAASPPDSAHGTNLPAATPATAPEAAVPAPGAAVGRAPGSTRTSKAARTPRKAGGRSSATTGQAGGESR